MSAAEKSAPSPHYPHFMPTNFRTPSERAKQIPRLVPPFQGWRILETQTQGCALDCRMTRFQRSNGRMPGARLVEGVLFWNAPAERQRRRRFRAREDAAPFGNFRRGRKSRCTCRRSPKAGRESRAFCFKLCVTAPRP